MTNSGQFKKGNKVAKKKKAKYKAYHKQVPNTPRENPTRNENDEFIPQGVANDFPHALASLNRKSPVQRALLRSKTNYITGDGFITEVDKLEQFLQRANAKETFRDVHRKIVNDKLSQGNAYLQIVYKGGELLAAFHIDATKCRVSVDEKSVIIHPDWLRYQNNRDLAQTVAIYPEFTKGDKGARVSMIHIKDYEPEFHFYGIPSSIAGLDAAGIAYKTNKWNVSRLDNDFKTSGILIVDADFSDEDARQFDLDFDKEFTGEGNQGRVLKIRKNVGDNNEGTKFVPVTNNTEGDWISLHKQSTDELVISHQWFRSLAGLGESGQLGNTQQIRNEYTIALNTIVSDEQKNLLSVYNNIFEDFGLHDPELALVNKPIVELKDIDINGILNVVAKVKAGEISKDGAILLLQLSYGVTKENSVILIETNGNI